MPYGIASQEAARLRLHRILVAIHTIMQHHPASQTAAADAAQPAHAQEEHAAAADLYRAVQRVVSEAQSGVQEAAAAHEAASTAAHGDMQDGANGGGKPDTGLGFVSEDEDEEVRLASKCQSNTRGFAPRGVKSLLSPLMGLHGFALSFSRHDFQYCMYQVSCSACVTR